jgi:hypothetical protein
MSLISNLWSLKSILGTVLGTVKDRQIYSKFDRENRS